LRQRTDVTREPLQSSLLAGILPAVISGVELARNARSWSWCRGLQNVDRTARDRCATRNHRKLALGELEALARALLPVFLAFFHTGIARKKTVFPE